MKEEKIRFKGVRVLLLALFLTLGFSAAATSQETDKLRDEQVETLNQDDFR